MKLSIALTAATFVSLIAAAPASAADISGNWARGDGKAKVKIASCQGGKVCATNTWIKPGTPSEKAGDVLVMDIAKTSGGGYSGSAYDPQRDMTYKISVSLNGDKMTTKGCVLAGIICKGVNWTRLN